MKKITQPDLTGAVRLTPAQMNKIHFAGNRTPLTPEQLREMAAHAASEKTVEVEKHSEK